MDGLQVCRPSVAGSGERRGIHRLHGRYFVVPSRSLRALRGRTDRPEARILAVTIPAFAAVGAAARLGLAPIRTYGVLFVAVFAWLGLHHPPRSSLKVLPLFVLAYVVPLIDATPPLSVRALLIVGATCVFVGETIATERLRTVRAQADGARSAQAFRLVATASASLQRLDPEGVLDAVVDGVMSLGYEGANLVVIDDPSATFVLVHPRGLSLELGTERQPIGNGLTAMVQRSRQATVVEDYATWEHAIDFYRHSGVRALIGVPVLVGEQLIGVLVASTRSSRRIPAWEMEPLQALADVAGAALSNVKQYRTEQLLAIEQTRVALTDGLTGLANRRHADEVLHAVRPGTSIVMIDVDHFRAVNARLGHAGGDIVLQAISAHLATGLRDEDFLARFGGEELLLVLPGRDAQAAVAVVERIAESWRATKPAATFSAGVALHRGGDIRSTLASADAALYEAKNAGRDRTVAEHAVEGPSR
ncbi:MAG: diguanylate cyclase [Acidimicrobiales bacterium]|nr:diguanylate cyclase [Acidimicrobiales bacterium]